LLGDDKRTGPTREQTSQSRLIDTRRRQGVYQKKTAGRVSIDVSCVFFFSEKKTSSSLSNVKCHAEFSKYRWFERPVAATTASHTDEILLLEFPVQCPDAAAGVVRNSTAPATKENGPAVAPNSRVGTIGHPSRASPAHVTHHRSRRAIRTHTFPSYKSKFSCYYCNLSERQRS